MVSLSLLTSLYHMIGTKLIPTTMASVIELETLWLMYMLNAPLENSLLYCDSWQFFDNLKAIGGI